MALSLGCAGCSGASLAPRLALDSPHGDALGDASIEGGEKTLAAKVLAAMALERTTGRAPDPARLGELN